MKKNKKIKVLSAMIAPLTLAGPLFVLSSCATKTFSDKLYQDTISEFIDLCTIPRPTFHTKKVCEYIKDRVENTFGLGKDAVMFDNYEPPISEQTAEKDWGHNLKYDIMPNSPETRYYDPIIIQCHTDMVWVTDPTKTLAEDYPIPVYDRRDGKEVIHTNNFSSSLGADNGIGVAIALALTKNRDSFKHGLIRILMTTDEEDGPSGAASVPNDWLKGFPYLLNIDLEQEKRVCDSAAGFVQANWERQLDLVPTIPGAKPSSADIEYIYDHGWTIIFQGLLGGHSAKYINDHRINPILEAFTLLTQMCGYDKTKKRGHIQIFKMAEKKIDEKIREEDKFINTNAIPNYFAVSFAADEKWPDEKTIWEKIKSFQDQLKNRYPNEKNFEIALDYWDADSAKGGVVTSTDTYNLCKFVCNLVYGPENDIFPDGTPKTSRNISGIRMLDSREYENGYSNKKGFVHLEVMGRSVLTKWLGDVDPTKETDPLKWDGLFMEEYFATQDKTDAEWTWDGDARRGWTPTSYAIPWTDDNSKLRKLIKSAGDDLGYDIQEFNEHSWLELSQLKARGPKDLSISAIGPTVLEPHSINEMLYTKTVNSVIKTMLGVFEKLKPEERSRK